MPPVSTLTPSPASSSSRGDRLRARDRALLALAEGVGGGDPERDRLARDHVLERAALLAGEDGRVDLLRVLLAAEDQPAARAAERLVDGGRDDVGVRHRVRVQAGGDEPGEVRHVDHQVGADLVGDLAEAREVEHARVGRPAGEQQLRPPLAGDPRDLVHVDQVVVRRDLVGRDVVQAAGDVDLHAVGEVAAVRQREAHDRVARLQQRVVDGRRWPARPRAAGRWRARRRTAPSRGRSRAARSRRRARSRRSSACPDSPRRTCSSARCPGTRGSPAGTKFSDAIISSVRCWRSSSRPIASATSGSTSASGRSK